MPSVDRISAKATYVRDSPFPGAFLDTLLDGSGLAALKAKPWFKDGLSDEEIALVGYLGSIANRDAGAATALVGMPFLESVESRDTLALQSLEYIAWRDAGAFEELMSHPRIQDGITDEETKIVAVLGESTIFHGAPGSAQVLLAETGVYIEERLIELPHTGETLLAVIRVEDKVRPAWTIWNTPSAPLRNSWACPTR